ncbi:hypothetical protein [Variovorax sp. Sphag1AA]|uniref:hypothetical protein n=1 Tax=Variovorax sp. Sphag1AA TaxID=2587027 RepID=UPI00160EFF4B|nr:hypothetical protein [Variovorax sp. Sphag1AA]MBB3181154.1 hypothetical protein [Variovorax sp. Sphag1AA]
MESFAIDRTRVRDISHLLLDDLGRLRVTPSRILSETTRTERLLFGILHGFYSFPTTELCEFLRGRIGGRSAIEIGAGHGILARELGIPATDNRQQEEAAIKAHYERLGQPTVPYGDNVERLDAAAAVAQYKPEVVIACWVTHRYDPSRPQAGGSETDVDEAAIIGSCDEYIFVGNEHVHANKPIWQLPHERLTPPWLYSRAANGSGEFIAIWNREQLRAEG